MKIEQSFFRIWIRPDITVEQRAEAAHELFRILIDPPRSPAELRRVVVRAAMAQYDGAPTRRAKELADRYRSYLASGWLRERDMEQLPEPHSTERVLLHRLARVNAGRPLGWRRIFDIAAS